MKDKCQKCGNEYRLGIFKEMYCIFEDEFICDRCLKAMRIIYRKKIKAEQKEWEFLREAILRRR